MYPIVKPFLRCLLAKHLFVLLSFVVTALVFLTMFLETRATQTRINLVQTRQKFPDTPRLTASSARLFHFVQVSDTHLSKDHALWVSQFEDFCVHYLPRLDPSFVIHTGDMVESKVVKTPMWRSRQIEREWIWYRDAVSAAGEIYLNGTLWVDLRGNHDASSVPSFESSDNLFTTYGVTGNQKFQNDEDLQMYSFVHRTDFGDYQILLIDQTPVPGLSLPFNFYGEMSDGVLNRFEIMLQNSTSLMRQTLVAGHYPQSFFSSNRGRFWNLLQRFSIPAYLCGHTHTANMWGKFGNVLELEGDDMQTSRGYRIIAFDHDIFTFKDTTLDDFIVISITNPADARFMTSNSPVHLISSSTHIRVLVFSVLEGLEVQNVEVQIDSSILCPSMNSTADYPTLFTCEWDPTEYSRGLHEIQVSVIDSVGNVTSQTQKFSTDGSTEFIGMYCTVHLLTVGQYGSLSGLDVVVSGQLGFVSDMFAVYLSPDFGMVLHYSVYQSNVTPSRGASWTQVCQRFNVPAVSRGCFWVLWMLWFAVIIGGGGLQMYLQERKGTRKKWLEDMHAKLDVEARGFTDENVYPLYMRLNAATWWPCIRLYSSWQLEHAWWRFTALPTVMYLALIVHVFLYIIPFGIIGPFNSGSWAFMGIYGLFDGTSYYPEQAVSLLYCAYLLLWTTPLMKFCSLPVYRTTTIQSLFTKSTRSIWSIENLLFIVMLAITPLYALFGLSDSLGVVTASVSPMIFPHWLGSCFLVYKTIQLDRQLSKMKEIGYHILA